MANNLPESFYVDPTVLYGGGAGGGDGGATSYARATVTAAKPPVVPPVNLNKASLEQLVIYLNEPKYREEALALLNKKKSKELALLLWKGFNTIFILLEEVISLYKLLSPPKLAMTESNRVCNALALFQCIAAHPNTRMGLVRAKIPVYLFPFIRTSEKERPFEYLKLTSLGVIGALVKVEDSNTPQVIHFLLESEILPLCLACMEHGNELTQTVATYILSKILLQREGVRYCSVFAERFFVVASLLEIMTNRLPPEPPLQLLKHIISCFLSLAEVPRLVGSHAHDALMRFFPARLTDPKFIRIAVEDQATKPLLEALLQEVSAGPWANKPKAEPVVEAQGGPVSAGPWAKPKAEAVAEARGGTVNTGPWAKPKTEPVAEARGGGVNAGPWAKPKTEPVAEARVGLASAGPWAKPKTEPVAEARAGLASAGPWAKPKPEPVAEGRGGPANKQISKK